MERQPEKAARTAAVGKGDRRKASWWLSHAHRLSQLPSHEAAEIWSYKGGGWVPVKSISVERRNKDIPYDEDWTPRLIVDFHLEDMGLCRKKVQADAGLLRISAQQAKIETAGDSVAVSCWGAAAQAAVDSSMHNTSETRDPQTSRESAGFPSESRDTREEDYNGNEPRSPMSPASPKSLKTGERRETREARRERRKSSSSGAPMPSDKAQEHEQISHVERPCRVEHEDSEPRRRRSERQKRAEDPSVSPPSCRGSTRSVQKRAEERRQKDDAVQQNEDKTKYPSTTSTQNEQEENDTFVFGSVFELGNKIGSGSFSSVFTAKNLHTGEEVAIKLEQVETDIPQLLDEAKMLSRLGSGDSSGVLTRVHWYGTEMNYNVLVMDLLGSSVAGLLSQCGGKFRPHTALTVTTQMLAGVEYVHQKGYIHRDLKPENFAIGLEDNAHIRIIDFGLARRYRCPKTHRHNPRLEGGGFAGTARYASARAHRFEDQSRRDDVESLGYVAVQLFLGSLPWQGVGRDLPKLKKHAKLAKIKEHTQVEDLCNGVPQSFVAWFNHCQCLDFEQEPDYRRLRKVLQACSTSHAPRLLDWEM